MNLEPKRKMPNVRYSIFFIIVKGSQGFVRRVRLLAQCALATSGGQTCSLHNIKHFTADRAEKACDQTKLRKSPCDIKERNQSGINTVLDQNLSTLICANETTTHNV